MSPTGRRGGLVAVAVAALVLAAGCGGDDDAGSPLDRALGYLPADASVAISISTDLDSENYANLDNALQRFGLPGGIEAAIGDSLESEEISFSELESQLGNEFVLGLTDLTGDFISIEGEPDETPFVAALEVADGAEMEDLLTGIGELEQAEDVAGASVFTPTAPELPEGVPEIEPPTGPVVAIDDEVLVIAEALPSLEAALERADTGDGLDEETFAERFGELPDDAILRASADAQTLLDASGADVATGIPWVAGLESLALTITVGEDSANLDVLARGGAVADDELPIAAGSEGPKLYPDLASIANLDQSQTISFFIAAIEASVPRAAFDEVTGRLADEAGTDLPALADAFGAGVRAETADGQPLSRTEVTDRNAVAGALRGLRDQVPRLAELESGGEPATTALGLGAALVPALPLPEGYFPPSTKVEPVPGEPDLYRLRAPENPIGPGSEFVFGLIGDVLVSAPDVEQARRMASDPPDAEPVLPGTVAGRIPINAGDLGLDAAEGENVALTVIDLGLEATAESLHLRLEASL